MADNQMRGQLQVQADLQGQGSASSSGAALPDSGMAETFSGLSQQIAHIGNKVGAWADHAAKVEGAQAGELAGLDPEFRPSRQLTIRGEAFDKAGLHVMQSKLKQGIAADLEGIADKSGHDPVAVKKAIEAKRAGWMGNVPDEIKAEVTLFIDGQSSAAMRQASRVQRANFVAEQHAAAHAEFMTEMKSVQQQAFQMGLDPAADQVVAEGLARAQKLMSRKGADGRPLFSPMERVKALEKLTEETAQNRTMGAFMRLPDLEAKARFIEAVKADYATPGGDATIRGQAKLFSGDGFRSLVHGLEAEYNRGRVEQSRQAIGIKHDVATLTKLAEKGMAPSTAELAALTSRVEATKDPELIGAFADANAVLGATQYWRTLPPAQLDTELKAMREKAREAGTMLRSQKLLEVGENMLSHMRTEIEADPLSWADKTGLLKLVPLELKDGATFAASLRARVPQAEAAAQHFGQKVDYIRPDEARDLSARIAAGGAQGLEILSAIASGAPRQAASIMTELGKHGPATAQLGRLVMDTGNTSTVRDAADGLALLRFPDFKPIAPEASKTRDAFIAATSGALGNRAADASAVHYLANAIYEKRAAAAGAKTFDETIYKKAVSEALGEHKIGDKTYGGVVSQSWLHSSAPIVLPPFVRADKWQDVIKTITPDDLKAAGLSLPVGADGKPIAWSRIVGGTLVQTDHARYAVALGDPATPGQELPAKRADNGKNFIIDLRELRPILAKRRPDLFAPER